MGWSSGSRGRWRRETPSSNDMFETQLAADADGPTPTTLTKLIVKARGDSLECFSYKQIVCFFIDAHPRRRLSTVRFGTLYGRIPASVSQRSSTVPTSPSPPQGTRMEATATGRVFGLFSRSANPSPSRFRNRDRFCIMGDGGHSLTYFVVARPTI